MGGSVVCSRHGHTSPHLRPSCFVVEPSKGSGFGIKGREARVEFSAYVLPNPDPLSWLMFPQMAQMTWVLSHLTLRMALALAQSIKMWCSARRV